MAKLSELRPGQKVAFSPIQDKTQKMTGEIINYVFLAVIQTSDGATAYAHSDDVDVLEQPKLTLSEEMKSVIAEQGKAAVASSPAPAPVAAAPEWEEGEPAKETPEPEQTP